MQRKHIGTFSQLSFSGTKRPAPEPELYPAKTVNIIDASEDDPVPIIGESSTAFAIPETTHRPKKQQRLLSSYISEKMTPDKKEEIDRDLLDLFIKDYQPFSIVEDAGFKKFTKWIPGYELPSRKTISNSMIPALYHESFNMIVLRS